MRRKNVAGGPEIERNFEKSIEYQLYNDHLITHSCAILYILMGRPYGTMIIVFIPVPRIFSSLWDSASGITIGSSSYKKIVSRIKHFYGSQLIINQFVSCQYSIKFSFYNPEPRLGGVAQL